MDSSSEQHNPYGASLIMRHYSQIMPKHFDISPNIPIDSADGFELIKSNQQTGKRVYFPSNRCWKSNSNALSIHMLITILGDGANCPRYFREKGVQQ
jgi:hypothetical protein